MNRVIWTVLSNPQHPEYGQASIAFPVFDEEYEHTLELLSALEIGSAVGRDCQIDEIDSRYPILKRLGQTTVNLDELNYLAKRLDSACAGLEAKYQGMAVKLGISDITNFINLTFCCQEATVITDFSDLEKIGKEHMMTLYRGCMPAEVPEQGDARMKALDLILNHSGSVTPYGVVYDNGAQLVQFYDGRHLPECLYDPGEVAALYLSLAEQPTVREVLIMPCAESMIKRALQRLGVSDTTMYRARLESFTISDAVCSVFVKEFELKEHLDTLNQFCRCYKGFDDDTVEKFHTVFDYAWPQTPEEVLYLAQNIHEFTVVNGISTAEEYGRYIIQESGQFEIDPNLEGFIDYQKYGEQRIFEEGGVFADRGYLSYAGTDTQVLEILARNGQPTEEAAKATDESIQYGQIT